MERVQRDSFESAAIENAFHLGHQVEGAGRHGSRKESDTTIGLNGRRLLCVGLRIGQPDCEVVEQNAAGGQEIMPGCQIDRQRQLEGDFGLHVDFDRRRERDTGIGQLAAEVDRNGYRLIGVERQSERPGVWCFKNRVDGISIGI